MADYPPRLVYDANDPDPDIATVTFGTWHDAIAQLFQRP
jgi:hypothetical protein